MIMIQFNNIADVIDEGNDRLAMAFDNIYVGDDRYDIFEMGVCIGYYSYNTNKYSLISHVVQKAKTG